MDKQHRKVVFASASFETGRSQWDDPVVDTRSYLGTALQHLESYHSEQHDGNVMVLRIDDAPVPSPTTHLISFEIELASHPGKEGDGEIDGVPLMVVEPERLAYHYDPRTKRGYVTVIILPEDIESAEDNERMYIAADDWVDPNPAN